MKKIVYICGQNYEHMDEAITEENTNEYGDYSTMDEASEISTKGSSDSKENTRSRIALIYVCAFFVVIGIVLIGGVCLKFEVDELKDMLVTVSGGLSGPLGFIVGYYFKASKE
jgi:hypothetical protein